MANLFAGKMPDGKSPVAKNVVDMSPMTDNPVDKHPPAAATGLKNAQNIHRKLHTSGK